VAAAQIFAGSDMFDGLMYPAVAMRLNAENLALKPGRVDAKVRFVSVDFVRVTAVRELAYDVEVTDFARADGPGGSLAWRGRPGNWVLTRQGEALRMVDEDGRWVARTPEGALVDPT
jgi:hypothetical protein